MYVGAICLIIAVRNFTLLRHGNNIIDNKSLQFIIYNPGNRFHITASFLNIVNNKTSNITK